MKYVLILLIMSTPYSIQKSNAQTTIMEKQAIIIPKIDNSFETFDIKTFNKEKRLSKRMKKESEILIEEDSYTTGFIRRTYSDSSYFKYNKLFYKSLGIKKKGVMFNDGSKYGIWYEFDEQGNLIETIDTDAGYDFTWEQVIHYCEENKIKLIKGYKRSGFKTKIYKEESEEGNKIWVITYQISGDQLIELTLDGKTGEELKRKEIGFINH